MENSDSIEALLLLEKTMLASNHFYPKYSVAFSNTSQIQHLEKTQTKSLNARHDSTVCYKITFKKHLTFSLKKKQFSLIKVCTEQTKN